MDAIFERDLSRDSDPVCDKLKVGCFSSGTTGC